MGAAAAAGTPQTQRRSFRSSNEDRAAVIGGGYAGLAAAVELAARGVPVTVFEAARELGGRARRVVRREATLDNGCHILLGCYRDTLRLLERVSPGGTASGLMRLDLELHVPRTFRFRAPRLPSPFHVLAGMLAARGIPLTEKLRALRFMGAMNRSGFRLPRDESVSSLLSRHAQSGRVAAYLWQPLCIAALNTPPDSASAQVFLNVLRDSLRGDRAASDLLLPRVDLSRLFPEPAADFIARHGGVVRLGATVNAIGTAGGGLRVNGDGGSREFSWVVCAASPHRAGALLAGVPGLESLASRLGRLRYQPIYSVYLQYPEDIRLPHPMTGMAGGLGQWVFDRGVLCHQPGLLGVVISGPGPHEAMGREALARRVAGELATMFPRLPAPRWHQVIAEKRATIAATVGLERPTNATPVPGLYLAGDYTDPEYPATLEAAVRSGVKCARLILGEA